MNKVYKNKTLSFDDIFLEESTMLNDSVVIKKDLIGNYVKYGKTAEEEREGIIIDKVLMAVSNHKSTVVTGYLIVDSKTNRIDQIQNWRILEILK